MLCKWSHTACNLWGLALFMQHNPPESHPSCCIYQLLVPFYCWVVFHGMDVWMYHTLLNYLPVQEQMGWDFPGGAVVKNPPANAGDVGSSAGPGRSHMPRSN